MSKHKYGDGNLDLELLTGLTPKSVTGYTRLYPAIMLHEVAEQTLDNTNGKLNKCSFTIPKVGKVYVSLDKTKNYSYEFVPDEEFERHLKRAVNEGVSPLEKILETTVISMINQKYRDLL